MLPRISRREYAKSFLDRAIRKALESLPVKPRRAVEEMIQEIQSRSILLRPSAHVGRIESDSLDAILQGLVGLSAQGEHWLRPIESWQPSGSRLISQFSSLAHHLVADYPVPPVMLKAWFLGTTWPARLQQRWFIHVGQGGSLRKAGFPLDLNRKTAHEFTQAPSEFPIDFALRWAQVRAMGGTDELARAVAATRLGRDFGNDDFWVTVLHFLINHPRIELAKVKSIVNYLHHQKFAEQDVVIGEDTEVAVDPPQPDLSIKGWTVSSLMRRVEEWQSRPKVEEKPRTLIRWARSTIGEFTGTDGDGQSWTIRELLNSDELAEEGKAMDHCVATYTACCARRDTTIWSVSLEAGGTPERVATVEVNPVNRELVQAKARSNDDPSQACLSILKRWASLESLQLLAEEREEPLAAVEPVLAAIDTDFTMILDVTIGASIPSWQYMTG